MLDGEIEVVILAAYPIREVDGAPEVDQRRIHLRRRSGGNPTAIRMETGKSRIRTIREQHRDARRKVIRRRREIAAESLNASVGVAILFVGVVENRPSRADHGLRKRLPGEP